MGLVTLSFSLGLEMIIFRIVGATSRLHTEGLAGVLLRMLTFGQLKGVRMGKAERVNLGQFGPLFITH